MSDADAIDPGVRAAYAQLRAQRASAAVDVESLLPPETLLALAEGSGDAPERLAQLDRVLADPVMRDEFYLLRAVVRERDASAAEPQAAAAPETTSARVLTLSPRSKRSFWISSAAAASLFVAATALLLRKPAAATEDPFRGAASGAVTLLAPAAEAAVTQGTSFAWHAVTGASSYELLVLDREGQAAFRTTTRDTVVRVGAAIADGQWTVTATMPDGTRRESEPRRLSAPR